MEATANRNIKSHVGCHYLHYPDLTEIADHLTVTTYLYMNEQSDKIFPKLYFEYTLVPMRRFF